MARPTCSDLHPPLVNVAFGFPLTTPVTGAAFAALAAINAVFVAWGFQDSTLGREHGPLENFQALSLVLATFFFALSAWRCDRRAVVILASGLGLLCWMFFLLEFDTRTFGNAALIWITNGIGRAIWLGALWGALALATLTALRSVWTAFRAWLTTASGYAMLTAGACWILAKGWDKGGLPHLMGMYFLEELIEVNAACLMLGSALLLTGLDRSDSLR